MASSPITAWQIEGEKAEVVTDFLFLGSKITVDGDCSHEIRRWLLLGRKAMTNLNSVLLVSRDVTLPTKVHIVKAIGTSGHVQLWKLDSKEGRMPKNRCLQTAVLEKTPESNLDSKDIRQSILREIKSEYLLERLMLKLKLQCFGHLMQTADSLEESLMLGKIEGRRRKGHQRMRWLVGVIDAMDMNLGKLWEMLRGREALCAVVHGVAKTRTWLGNWATRTAFYNVELMTLGLFPDAKSDPPPSVLLTTYALL